jgi:Flp pilus assembly protein TadD
LNSSPTPQSLERLRAASSLLFARRPAEAVSLLNALKAQEPGLAEARRLLGIALRETGDLVGAERELRGALVLGETVESYEALAATLERDGRRPEAEDAYRKALSIEPNFTAAAIGLSELLLNENRIDEAVAVIEPAGTRPGADIHGLSAYALALTAARRLAEPTAVYQRAVQVAPRSAVAEHNVAGALGTEERFAEAEAAARRAFAKGLDAPQTWLVLARALQGQGRFDEAEVAYGHAITRNPTDPDAHIDLAQLIWMRSEDTVAALDAMNAALTLQPVNPRMTAAKARVLEYAGQEHEAYAVLAQAIAQGSDDPALHIQASHVVARADPNRALTHARRAAELAPASLDALTAHCLANLAVGDAESAAQQAAALRERAPLDQHALALQATAWRMLGDPRYGELCDYDGLVGSSMIDIPDGWSDLDVFLRDLAERLERRTPLRGHPIGQSLRRGVQSQQRLDRTDDPVIRAFFQAIDGPIRRYLQAIGTGQDPHRARNTGDYQIAGAWSARLRPGGYHTDHLHAKGWISSACHIVVPSAVDQGQEGWLRFGQPGVPTTPALEPERFVRPEPGRLVLFPSSRWHGTVPFGGDQARLTVAFDLLPK